MSTPIHYRTPHAIAITICAMLLLVMVQTATLYMAALWQYGALSGDALQLASSDSLIIFSIVLVCAVVMMAFCILLIYVKAKKSDPDPLPLLYRFFALDRFSLHGLLIAVGILAIYLVLSAIAGELLQKDPMVFLDVIDTDHLWLLIIAIVLVAPVYEEVLFRGLLFGIWHDRVTAVVVSSVLFSLVHFQYDWFGLVLIFIIGLIFGWVRHRYGLTVAIILHMLNNAIALFSYYLL